MKKTLSLIAIMLMAVLAYTQAAKNGPLRNIKQQTYTYDFQNNNGNWPVGEGVNYADGNVIEPLVAGPDDDQVLLTAYQGTSLNPVCIMSVASRGICLWVFKGTSIKFSAAEGRAIKKIEVTMQTGDFDLTPSNGEVADNVWTGNAAEVVFGPNANATRYIWQIAVTVADKDDDTIEPAPIDVEAANIAAFNAAEDGKNVKLTLDNARVNAYYDMQGCYYVEDASGATVIKGVTLTPGTALSGYIVGMKSTNDQIDYVNTPAQAVEHVMTATDILNVTATTTTLEGTPMTITEACAQANYGRLITLSNVAISGTGQNKTLTDGNGNTMKARDYLGVLPNDYEWPESAATITGVVIYYMTGWFIMPLSEEAIVEAGAQSATVTFDFTLEGDQSLRGYVGTTMTDVQGYIYNEVYTVDDVTLQITAGSAPSRIYRDNNRGVNLVTYKEYTTLTFCAPDGYAITSIAFTAAGNSNINNFTASSGAIEGMTWTGNAKGVRFLQGGTSYLANAIVTLAAADDATLPVPVIEYTECANIAAFNALEPGTFAKVTLTDAEVIGKSADGYSTVWIQDATGGCWMQYTSLNTTLDEGTKVSGTIYTVARHTSGNQQMKEAPDTPNSILEATAIDGYTIVEGTLAEVNVAANLNKVVKISGATLEQTSATAGKLTQGDATIDVNNGSETANQQLHKIGNWAKDTQLTNITVVAILVAKSATANQLLPISIENTPTGISSVSSDSESVSVFSLQGVRLNKLQRGVNIVNGKKIVVK